jgi:hypothetical protein
MIAQACRRTARMGAVALATVMLAATGCGITASHSNPGYANLDSLGLLDTDRVVSISIGSSLLGLAARHSSDDPQAQALLSGLQGVRVRVYEVEGDVDKVAARMQRMSAGLQASNWQPVLVVQDSGVYSRMLVKQDGERIAGLVVMSLDGGEAVLVNIMGDLKPELFADTMAQLELDSAPDLQLASASN